MEENRKQNRNIYVIVRFFIIFDFGIIFFGISLNTNVETLMFDRIRKFLFSKRGQCANFVIDIYRRLKSSSFIWI